MLGFRQLAALVTIARLCAWSHAAPASFATTDLRHHAWLQDGFLLSWTPLEREGVFELTVATQGYVALGFSATGAMKGADMIIAWITDQDQLHISDRYAIGTSSPLLDEVQDFQELSFERNASHTRVRFARAWDTCDTLHDYAITKNDATRVMFAYHPSTPADPSALPYHTTRGAKTLYLREPQSEAWQPEGGVKVWEIRAPGVDIPATVQTLYWCNIVKVPPIEEKHHIVRMEPILDEASGAVPHHVVLYECRIEDSELYLEQWVGHKGAQCHTPAMPDLFTVCSFILVAWGIGSDGTTMPAEAGYPMHEKYGGATYLMMETHYDNYQREEVSGDRSGLRLYYTPRLRPHDLGQATIGHMFDASIIVPPGEPRWDVRGHCSSECTRDLLPAEGVLLTTGLLHAHLLGQAITLRHIRDGQELEPILRDDNYDFNYQQDRMMENPRRILPGDHLIVECTYNSLQRNKTSYGGIGTYEEMCNAFISYYPRVEAFSWCASRPTADAIAKPLGIKLREGTEPARRTRTNANTIVEEYDPEEDRSHMENTAEGPLTPMIDIYLSKFYFFAKIEEPTEMQNLSLLEVLEHPPLWEEPGVRRALQASLTGTGDYEVACQIDGLPEEQYVLSQPKFKKFEGKPTQCGLTPP